MFKANSKEEIEQYLRTDKHNKYLLELPTGLGKTYLSIMKLRQWNNEFAGKFLIVIPKNVLIKNWKSEFEKFDCEYLLDKIVFTTYVSLQKHVDEQWEGIVFDEIHHLSDRCKGIFSVMKYNYFIGLSATLKKEVKNWLYFNIRGLDIVRMQLKDAIDNEILPSPKVILIPMYLDKSIIKEIIVRNPKMATVVDCSWRERVYYMTRKDVQVHIHCTEQQWYDYYTNSIEKMKNKPVLKNAYLAKCGKRLKWLSNKKTDFVKEILKKIRHHRIITFCNSIEQSKLLGKNSINSKNGIAQDILNNFNNKVINKVTCVEMLTEGCNLSDCKVGVFATLNSSKLLQFQKTGRLLRHPKPVLIIPYYKNTRDEEIVMRMVKNYDENMVVEITDINELTKNI